jgi:hypothetical protein
VGSGRSSTIHPFAEAADAIREGVPEALEFIAALEEERRGKLEGADVRADDLEIGGAQLAIARWVTGERVDAEGDDQCLWGKLSHGLQDLGEAGAVLTASWARRKHHVDRRPFALADASLLRPA